MIELTSKMSVQSGWAGVRSVVEDILLACAMSIALILGTTHGVFGQMLNLLMGIEWLIFNLLHCVLSVNIHIGIFLRAVLEVERRGNLIL